MDIQQRNRAHGGWGEVQGIYRGAKKTGLFEGGIRVPAAISWPGENFFQANVRDPNSL